MRVLDLFSGIGGFSLGLERAGMRTVAFCEIDPKAQAVLAKHWPDIPCHDDIKTLVGEHVGSVDVVCGGPPCQPISSASRGRRKGVDDDRWLWPEMGRLVGELRPSWVLCENTDDLDGMGLDQIADDLEAMGYQVLPFGIPACARGADHIRPRCFVVGHTDRQGQSDRAIDAEMAGVPQRRSDARSSRGAHVVPSRVDRRRLIGNSVMPAIVRELGRAIMAMEGRA